MIKFLHLFKNYYLGISFIGIAAFVIQEIPYIVTRDSIYRYAIDKTCIKSNHEYVE